MLTSLIVQFDGILQYRSVQVSHMFTESSHIQSEKMEQIAYKTEKETISMHVITCVTLAFLPGTFVAVSNPAMSHPNQAVLTRFASYLGFLSKWSDRDKSGHLPSWGIQAVRMYLLSPHVSDVCALGSAVQISGS
jgi:hypothetical protein